MKPKSNLLKWVLVISVIVSVPLAMLLPLAGDTFNLPDYSLRESALRFGIYFPVGVVGVWLLFLLAKLLRWFFRWKVLKWCLFAFVVFLALIPVFYAEENWRGHRAWENYKYELEAKGEKLDFAAFIPPRVPDEQNFAFAPVVMTTWSWLLDTNGHKLPQENTNIVKRLELTLFRTDQMLQPPTPTNDWRLGRAVDLSAWQNYYRTMFVTNRSLSGMEMPLMPGYNAPLSENGSVVTNLENTNEVIQITALATNEFPFAMQPQTPAADVLLALSKFDGALEDLRLAAQRPQSRFPLDYAADLPADIMAPHQGSFRNCVFVLSLRASARLVVEPAAALADIKLMLRLNESVRNEPFYYTQSTRAGWISLAMQPIWAGIVQRKWSDGQLAELDTALARLDFLADFVTGVRAQCAADVQTVEWCRLQSNKDIFVYGNGNSPEFNFQRWLNELPFRLFPDGWYALGKVSVGQTYKDRVLPVADLQRRILSPEKYSASTRLLYETLNSKKPWNFWIHFFFGAIRPERFAQAQTELDLARVAIALERHRLAVGNYPETLAALAPRFLEKIPHDVINGQPLHYRRTQDGNFLLYSVGWDENDDGGIVFKTEYGYLDKKKGDWVWMFPQP